MIVFLDTEFTDLVIHPRLLSAALVAASGPWSGQDFYGEVTDTARIEAAGWYALGAVLPQFGKVAHAACTYAELGVRLAAYFGDLVARLDTAEPVEVDYGYDLDWELVELAIRDSGSPNWEVTRRRIRPSNVYQVTGFGPAKLAAEAYFKSQAKAPFCRHHALCDARALRVANEAAEQDPEPCEAEPSAGDLDIAGSDCARKPTPPTVPAADGRIPSSPRHSTRRYAAPVLGGRAR